MIKYIYAFLAGAVFAAIFAGVIIYNFFIKAPDPASEARSIKTKQVSGARITHSNIKRRGEVIEFKTRSEGAGEIETAITVPEKRNIFGIGVSWSPMGGGWRMYSLEYYRRWRDFALGGGIAGGRGCVGITAGIMYFW